MSPVIMTNAKALLFLLQSTACLLLSDFFFSGLQTKNSTSAFKLKGSKDFSQAGRFASKWHLFVTVKMWAKDMVAYMPLLNLSCPALCRWWIHLSPSETAQLRRAETWNHRLVVMFSTFWKYAAHHWTISYFHIKLGRLILMKSQSLAMCVYAYVCTLPLWKRISKHFANNKHTKKLHFVIPFTRHYRAIYQSQGWSWCLIKNKNRKWT